MPLPILNQKHEPTRDDLIRLFHQTESRWTQHFSQEDSLDVGTAYSNPQFPDFYDANNIRDVALPQGMSPADAYAQVEAHYAARGAPCAYWVFNSSAPPDRTAPLAEHLLSKGHRPLSNDIMVLGRAIGGRMFHAPGLTIIPARASFRHTHQLIEEHVRSRGHNPNLADAAMLHLDDPHWDALLALKDGLPVAHIGVLAVGENCRIEEVLVAAAHRRQGIGLTMLNRALEICARSLFKNVMLCVLPTNTPAVNLYSKVGFHKIGQITSYFAPGVTLP